MAQGTWGEGGDGTEPVRIKIRWRYLQSRMQTGFYLRRLAALAATEQDIATHVRTEFLDTFRSILSILDTVEGVDATNIVTGNGAEISLSAVTGTLNGNLTPTFLQVPVNFKSGLRRRYGQGRGLWPIRDELHTTGDSLSPAGITAFQAVVNDLVAEYVGSGVGQEFQLVNVHGPLTARPASPTSPGRAAVPASWYDVTTVRLNPDVSMVYSRKQGIGS